MKTSKIIQVIEAGNLTTNDYSLISQLNNQQKQKMIDILDQDPRYYQERNKHYVHVTEKLKDELHGKPPYFFLGKNDNSDETMRV